ncbi:hypothetical protein AKG09_11250 [Neisseria sp. 83E34]|uniref:hypothetical protein n=1 Tax=Neisseria wadsworthii TaxID=607711 RepID=UPI0006CE6EAB|nr:hypothetical protein [Neisseria wadsworthii]KPN70594.1 hypothetical protein AKG09_11250 [Neisseria sp. 83E34]
MVEAALGHQTVEHVVGEAVAGAVFVGEADEPSCLVVVVAEGVAERIGSLRRQTVLAVFVRGGVAFAVGNVGLLLVKSF